MKKALKIASFFLSLLILFNSVGIAVFDHTCNFKKETARSLYKEHSCCEKKESTKTPERDSLTFSKTKCCETSSSVFVPSVFHSAGVDFKFTPEVFDLFAQVIVPSFVSIEQSQSFLRFSDCSGPPLSVRSTLYVLFEVFLI